MNREQFFAKLNPAHDTKLIAKAYWFAKEVHRSQKRDDGERYFEHCRRIACILIERHASTEEIIIALLHDCVEDGFIPKDLIKDLFGWYVAECVDILSKIEIVESENGKIEKKKKNLDEYYRAIANGQRTIGHVKSADRLDNVRTMGSWERARQQKYIAETECYVLPIARIFDQTLADAIEEELKKFTGPYVFEAYCTNCKRPTVVAARATVWIENKFLKYEHLNDARSWDSQEKPIDNPREVRDILIAGNWSRFAKIMNLGEYYCGRGEHFFCRGCVKFYNVFCDDPGWSPVELTPKCPTHGR